MATPTAIGTGLSTNAVASPSDAEGVGYLKIGSGLGIAVQSLFWLGFAIFYLIFTALQSAATSIGTTGSGTIPSWITVNTFYLAVGALAGGLFLGIVSFVFFFLGFRTIKKGAPAFGAPTTLMIIGLIGYLLAALGIVVIVGTIVSAINATVAGTLNAGGGGLALSAILGGLGLVALGGLLGLIGVIGLVLGNWRAGNRYAEPMAKVGAILSLVPFVSIVGYVLLLVGYIRAGSKLSKGWIPPQPAMPQLPPTAYHPAQPGYPAPAPAYYAAPTVPPPPPMNYVPAPPPPANMSAVPPRV